MQTTEHFDSFFESMRIKYPAPETHLQAKWNAEKVKEKLNLRGKFAQVIPYLINTQ